jgi:hypothetical protein
MRTVAVGLAGGRDYVLPVPGLRRRQRILLEDCVELTI